VLGWLGIGVTGISMGSPAKLFVALLAARGGARGTQRCARIVHHRQRRRQAAVRLRDFQRPDGLASGLNRDHQSLLIPRRSPRPAKMPSGDGLKGLRIFKRTASLELDGEKKTRMTG